jgi:hypothetical protein
MVGAYSLNSAPDRVAAAGDGIRASHRGSQMSAGVRRGGDGQFGEAGDSAAASSGEVQRYERMAIVHHIRGGHGRDALIATLDGQANGADGQTGAP